jgi:NAD(P)-dependent dehydrogenase (short-subunit alcohol dehydrogenase family)
MTNAVYPCLKEKPVLISGGASGIGEAIVKSFAAQGARVGFVDLMADAGAALAKELQNSGQTVMFQHCDITDTGEYQQAIRRFEEAHGPCLVLVNNAANDTRADWRQITAEEFNRRISINLAHAFFAIQAVAPGMMAARHGSIINFGSISWMAAQAGIPVYTAAKAATHGMTRSFARELGQYNIRHGRSRMGDDQAPARLVGRRRRQRTDRPESVSRRKSAAAGHRRDGDLPRLGQRAHVLGAELRCRRRLGLTDDR